MRANQVAWTDNEIAKLQDLIAQGLKRREIAAALGRSEHAIRGKVEYLGLSELQREERRQALRRRRAHEAIEHTTRIHPNGQLIVAGRPSEKLLRDRDYRAAMAPRSLTAALLGDPLPGYSALERRS